MNTRIKLIFIFGFCCFQLCSFAQSTFQLGILPAVNFNKKLKNDWSLNSRVETRLLVRRGTFDGDVDRSFNYVLTDLSLIAAKKFGLNSRYAFGYLLRLEEGDVQHRFIQQFTVVQKLSTFRLAHRFVTDQTFSPVQAPEFRLRYRITTEIPLNGESIDPREFYFRVNNEYLNSIQARAYDLEIRVVPLLGYEINDRCKVETGLDYRVNSFVANKTRHTFWMAMNFFIEF